MSSRNVLRCFEASAESHRVTLQPPDLSRWRCRSCQAERRPIGMGRLNDKGGLQHGGNGVSSVPSSSRARCCDPERSIRTGNSSLRTRPSCRSRPRQRGPERRTVKAGTSSVAVRFGDPAAVRGKRNGTLCLGSRKRRASGERFAIAKSYRRRRRRLGRCPVLEGRRGRRRAAAAAVSTK